MAGMLPGVEAARRRRVHQSTSLSSSSSSSPSSRRTSFSLFCSNSAAPSSLVQQRSRTTQHHQVVDEKLGQLAREAKERLDERLLRAQRKSPLLLLTRNNSDSGEERIIKERRWSWVRTEVYGTRNKGGGGGGGAKKKTRGGWANKLGWKAGDQQECAVCLDDFKVGENLVNLPCAHTFHSRCLLPWLDSNSHCPCCRTSIFS